MSMMHEAVMKGSVTARKYLIAHDMLLVKAVASLTNMEDATAAFRLFREARKVCEEVHVTTAVAAQFHEAAKNAVERNPEDSDALFVLAVCQWSMPSCDYAELTSMAKTCVSLDPDVPEYHHLLGCVHGCAGNHRDALGSLERAIELEPVSGWLYDRATALRLLGRDENEVFEAYEDYVKASEKDARKIPEAYYCIASMYLMLRDEVEAKKYWNMALETERDRLPCFGFVRDDYPPKWFLDAWVKKSEAAGHGRVTRSRKRLYLAGESVVSCGNLRGAFSKLSSYYSGCVM
jgi:tetratricopeptide (TPR) repeat protein